MRSKPPRWAIRNCSEPEDDTDTIAASALRDKLASSVARFADRRDDWSVFGFETALDPKFARAQRRYLGASGSVDHNDRRGWIRRPPSRCRSSRCHQATGSRCTATRQRRYPLFSNGKTRVQCCEKGERYDITLGRGDLVVLPPFLQDEVFNEGDNICHRQTLLARPQPLRPQYNDPELLKLQAAIP